jgi:hypothetical protein
MDIVYLCRGGENEELRLSLRSVDEHLPHDRVWIFGAAPRWVRNVELIESSQREGTKYRNTTTALRAACEHPDVSDPFVLFNDDFFIVEPVEVVPRLNRGPLDSVIDYYSRRYRSNYVRGMIETRELMRSLDIDEPLSYELHVPMIIEKQTMIDALDLGRDIHPLHKRTLYGNMIGYGGETIEDVKMVSLRAPLPTGPWLSTSDTSFVKDVGRILRWRFSRPSRYEEEERDADSNDDRPDGLRVRPGSRRAVPR